MNILPLYVEANGMKLEESLKRKSWMYCIEKKKNPNWKVTCKSTVLFILKHVHCFYLGQYVIKSLKPKLSK